MQAKPVFVTFPLKDNCVISIAEMSLIGNQVDYCEGGLNKAYDRILRDELIGKLQIF